MKRVGLPGVSSLDLAIVGGAGVAFLAGFLPWWGGSQDLVGMFSVSGWSAGFTAWAGTLLLTAAGILAVLRRAGRSQPSIAAGLPVLIAGVSAAGLLLVIIRWLGLRRHSGLGFDVGARYGIYVALMAGIAAVVELRTSGELFPWSRHGHPRPLG